MVIWTDEEIDEYDKWCDEQEKVLRQRGTCKAEQFKVETKMRLVMIDDGNIEHTVVEDLTKFNFNKLEDREEIVGAVETVYEDYLVDVVRRSA
jgi:hypothetical protein